MTDKVEMKICDRCGGLWFRPVGTKFAICARCAEKIKEASGESETGGNK